MDTGVIELDGVGRVLYEGQPQLQEHDTTLGTCVVTGSAVS